MVIEQFYVDDYSMLHINATNLKIRIKANVDKQFT